MNVALLLPKSGVQVRRRLGRRDAVPWPRGLSRTQTRSVSVSRSPDSVPLHSQKFVQLPSRSRSRSRSQAELPFGLGVPGDETRVTIYGKTFTQPFGRTIAPLRHNWGYSVKPSALNQIVVVGDFMAPGAGMTQAINHFSSITLPINKTYAVTNDINVLQQRFVDDWIPALDAGLKRLSVRGTTLFLLDILLLGLHLGVPPGYLYFLLFQFASTEGMSYLIDTTTPAEMNGNSMFMYANTSLSWILAYKSGFKSGWMLMLVALYGLWEFFMQFRVRASSKGLHFLGLFLGWIGYLLFI